LKCFPVETKCRGDAEVEVLNKNISSINECKELFALNVFVYVELDTALAAGPHSSTRFSQSCGIATRWFDLDDVRAVIGEQHRRHGASDPGCEVDDPDSPQNTGHGRHPA
jgi:hypothetical protein